MLRLVLVLSLCLVIVECIQVKRSEGCESLQACLSPIDGVTVPNIGRLGEDGAYQEFCQKASTFSVCYQDENAGCDRQSVRDSIKSMVDVAEFLCTEEARSEILAVSSSDCASNELKVLQLQLNLEGCE
ncbi:uncharacterized protein LOC131936353 [Physella acuta]|uniref:uncharacterized protein LOC131936353 n=1 Tax=Physella acuta TaxID=109671 RepID=UPI0027DAD91F|nr:uncharacterized protein LOC131936353 [Physella acuta]